MERLSRGRAILFKAVFADIDVMPFEAKVISLSTRPYTEAEMNELSHEEYGTVKHGRLEKVAAEEILADIVTEDKEEIRRRVIEIADKTNPRPIVVITNAFPDSFLVGRQCHPKRTLENTNIQFRVIGRRHNLSLSNYARYYSRLHNLRLHAATANIIADSTISFGYPKTSQ